MKSNTDNITIQSLMNKIICEEFGGFCDNNCPKGLCCGTGSLNLTETINSNRK